MQGVIAATKSSLMIENDLSLQMSESGSFSDVFYHVHADPENRPYIIRESTPNSYSTPNSDSSILCSDPFPPSRLTPPSPTSPDFSFLSSMSSPYKTTELEEMEDCEVLRTSTPKQASSVQDSKEMSTSQEVSTSQEQVCNTQEDDSQPSPEHINLVPIITYLCYTLLGDNIDEKVKPTDMRADHQSKSLHYFNTYVVQDQVDLRPLSNECRIIDPDEIDFSKFLPSAEDYEILNNFVLMSRILVEQLTRLSQYATVYSHKTHQTQVLKGDVHKIKCGESVNNYGKNYKHIQYN